jgi:hypothetical protein
MEIITAAKIWCDAADVSRASIEANPELWTAAQFSGLPLGRRAVSSIYYWSADEP